MDDRFPLVIECSSRNLGQVGVPGVDQVAVLIGELLAEGQGNSRR